jgi:hypothetical protein
VCFASFFSGGFITTIVLAKRTSVNWFKLVYWPFEQSKMHHRFGIS